MATQLEKYMVKVRIYAKHENLSAAGLEAVQDDMILIAAKGKEWKMDVTHLHHAFRKVAVEIEIAELVARGETIIANTDVTAYEIRRGPDGKRELVVR